MVTLKHIRALEERLASSTPAQCARLTKKIAALKDKLVNGKGAPLNRVQ